METPVRCPGENTLSERKSLRELQKALPPVVTVSLCLFTLHIASFFFCRQLYSCIVLLIQLMPPRGFRRKAKIHEQWKLHSVFWWLQDHTQDCYTCSLQTSSFSPTGSLMEIDHMKNSGDKNEEDKRVFPQWHNLLWMNHYGSVTSERRSKGLWEKNNIKE